MIDLNKYKAPAMSDETLRALILQCLYGSVGEGVSGPEIARFARAQTAKGVSEHRVEKALHGLVKGMFVNLDVKVTKGGSNRRYYSITGTGLLMLAATWMYLPKRTAEATMNEFWDLIHGADMKLARALLEKQGSAS